MENKNHSLHQNWSNANVHQKADNQSQKQHLLNPVVLSDVAIGQEDKLMTWTHDLN